MKKIKNTTPLMIKRQLINLKYFLLFNENHAAAGPPSEDTAIGDGMTGRKSEEDTFGDYFENTEELDLAKKKLTRARSIIYQQSVFFTRLMHILEFGFSNTLKTAATDGTSIKFSPKFVNELTMKEVVFLIQHEILHCAFVHFERLKGRNHELFNIAADYAINQLLQSYQSWSTMPPGALLDGKYTGMSAEQIYDILLKNGPPPKPEGGPGEPGKEGMGEEMGEVVEPGSLGKPASGRIVDKWKDAVVSAIQQDQSNPNLVKELVELIGKKTVNWKRELRKFITDLTKKMKYVMPYRRYIPVGVYARGPKRDIGVQNIVVALDTSGSLMANKQMLSQLFYEIQEIINALSIPNIYLMYFSIGVTDVLKVKRVTDIKLDDISTKIGNSKESEILVEMKKHRLQKAPLIILTDGLINIDIKWTHKNTLWCIYDDAYSNNLAQFNNYNSKKIIGRVLSVKI